MGAEYVGGRAEGTVGNKQNLEVNSMTQGEGEDVEGAKTQNKKFTQILQHEKSGSKTKNWKEETHANFTCALTLKIMVCVKSNKHI